MSIENINAKKKRRFQHTHTHTHTHTDTYIYVSVCVCVCWNLFFYVYVCNVCIWCFINKVREEHVQIINLINTRGEQSVINPVNKIRDVIYTADLPLFIGSFPASLRHPFSALTTIPVLICRGVVWVRAKIPSSEPSPRTARQIRINFILFIICKCELVKYI